ncbi:MAG: hypothetical protein Q7S84_00435 [bacterium]|nr:hypothetical protein [bacterium]
MLRYPENIVQLAIIVFKAEYGVDLTKEEAISWLDAFSDLYDCLAGSIRQGFGVSKKSGRRAAAGGRRVPRLDTPSQL